MASVSGFRGRVGESVTPELFCRLAAEFGGFLSRLPEVAAGGVSGSRIGSARAGRSPEVLLARDSRGSGAMLAAAVGAGLQSVGLRVCDLGVAPTPTLLFAVARGEAIGGIVVTASHNPAEWNALKLVGPDGLFLGPERFSAFANGLAAGLGAERAPWDRLGSSREDLQAVERHLEAIARLPYIQAEGIRKRRFRVAADCVGGVAGPPLQVLLSRLGCELVGIGMEADGRFHRGPEPLPANLDTLRALVASERADIGLAFDPDGDRLALVDELGVPPGEDMTLALAAASALERNRGPVVTNLSTSRVVEDVARSFGVELLRAPVGEINVARRMISERAAVGGEGNGGVILPDLHPTRDAFVATALVVQHLLDTGLPLSEAVARWPRYHIVKSKAPLPVVPLEEVYARLTIGLKPQRTDVSDGLRLEWSGDGAWLHVRPSGTEPVVRFIAEAPEEGRAVRLTELAARLCAG